jgi:hypothetical protein
MRGWGWVRRGKGGGQEARQETEHHDGTYAELMTMTMLTMMTTVSGS